MQKYMIGVVVFGLFPVLYCILHYMNDVIDYIQLDNDIDIEDTDIKVWQVNIQYLIKMMQYFSTASYSTFLFL